MVEAAKLNHIDTPVDEEFQIVGAGYKIHTRNLGNQWSEIS